MRPLPPTLALGFLVSLGVPTWANGKVGKPLDDAAFFEREIRPLLVERCQACHGEKRARGGLRLTDRESLQRGGEGGPILVSGKPAESRLLHAVEYRGDLKMPPKGKLSEQEIARLKRWVEMGAPWPNTPTNAVRKGETFEVSPAQRRWWAFQPVHAGKAPAVRNRAWVRTEIDAFILAELEKRNLVPAPLADRRTLVRRAAIDLTGLPPTPEEVDAFVRDDSPDAVARAVDRLLASPGYGVRWGRHWLDVVRYTDYHDGNPSARTASCEPLNAWRYRDWVVSALDADLPFDQFIIHQIAGDLLPAPKGQAPYEDGLVATTFLTNGSWDRGDADKEKMVSDMVDDQIDTIGKAFLGLTLGCARCHDHKFDPISRTDYYGLAGIFYSTRILQDVGTKGGEYTLQRIPLVSKSYLIRRDEQLRKITTLETQLKQRTGAGPNDPVRLELARRRAELLPSPPVAEAAQEGGTPGGLFPKIQDVPIHIRGSYTRLGEVVPRRMPVFLAGEQQPRIHKGSGRPELAQWIASASNPLTARVIVNRIWQGHFGTGLLRTPNNLGLLSEPPSHLALLDWLAARFVEDGWSLKNLHRRILLSAVYQQSSVVPRERLAQDPDNRWLGRFPARRLEAEAIRDAMLFVTGQLDTSRGGPATADLNLPRRSLYVQTARWDKSSFATLFDAANPDGSVEKRVVSTVAPQALFLLNHGFARTQAQRLAERLAREGPSDPVGRIRHAYRMLFGRAPSPDELAVLQSLLGQPTLDAWRDVAQVLLCCNEFVYLD